MNIPTSILATQGVYRAPFATITIAFARIFRVDSESGIESSQNEPEGQKREQKNESAEKRPKHGQSATIIDVEEAGKLGEHDSGHETSRGATGRLQIRPKNVIFSHFSYFLAFCRALAAIEHPPTPLGSNRRVRFLSEVESRS